MGVEQVIPVSAGARPYEVLLGRGVLTDIGEIVREEVAPARVAVVTDSNVGPLLGPSVLESMQDAGVDAYEIVVPAGEASKSWEAAGGVLERLASWGLERGDAVVALGGGVVGDLAGFCAASYLRGIACVQVPTTLLAQVDSSIGGKTAVDLSAGKNLAGAFWQPSVVVSDVDVLGTLSEDAWADGMAEVAKTAFLAGEPFMSWMEAEMGRVRERDADSVFEMVESCARFKAAVVGDDEREAGSREQLNLGHTLGHALERLEDYVGISHGVAVAAGLRFAALLAEHVLGVEGSWRARQGTLLDAAGIPGPPRGHAAADVIRAMHTDKKARGGVVRFVLSDEPGSFEVVPVADDLLAEVFALWDSGVATP